MSIIVIGFYKCIFLKTLLSIGQFIQIITMENHELEYQKMVINLYHLNRRNKDDTDVFFTGTVSVQG